MTKIISFLLLFSLCQTTIGQNNLIKHSDLIGCWKFYPEEKNLFPDMTVYRPCDYESFPYKRMVRGRFKLNFKANGECSYLTIGPTDINLMKPGKWTLDSSTNILEVFDLKMNLIGRYKIIKLEKRLLGIKTIGNKQN
jgi:hypothetical protein